MTQKIAGWQFLEELILNEAFQNEIEVIRRKDELTRASMTGYLLKKYNIPTKFYEVLDHYIETKKLEPGLISSKVRVVSDNEKTIEPSSDPSAEWRALSTMPRGGVSLKLSHDIRKTELINFIKDNWDDLIKPKLLNDMVFRRGVRDPDGDRLIYEEYLDRKSSNLRAIDIALKYDISEQQLYRIINRQENKD
ncbi:hypothetical protein PV379_04030 [Streptomyces caniscabiei]|uniref:hypothetical protein n=1 Tax=Streptomyces caniscabiei TaxID=2746961 RepID=UPI0029BD6F48|nr:hypothetical protein [Streptomyces caniscabiei]MDX2776506.1 hypothetical protein [Streptomyces caniscabiei]